jgi:hypothetical protein
MSWQDNIETSIVVICGDGKTYSPLYRVSPRTKDYNTTQFEFVGIPGTLVDRQLPKGYTQTVDLIFQGEDHLEDYKAFIDSADDRRPWAVYHPMFGNLDVQPVRITEDPTGLGLTEVRVDWMNTILISGPSVKASPKETVQQSSIALSATASQAFENNLIDPSVQDKALMQASMDDAYRLSSTIEKTGPEANKYFDLYTAASSKINEGIDIAQQLAFAAITVMTYPSYFTTGIRSRLLLLKNQFLSISAKLELLDDLGKKIVYETMAGALINAMANASVTVTTGNNLNSSVEVVQAAGIMSETYDSYLLNLDSLQTETYAPDVTVMSGLDILVNTAISQLLNIALSAKQERIVTLEEDSNLINLTHRFYGITSKDDSEIQKFIDQNNIGINEILQIKKGRRIVYYV